MKKKVVSIMMTAALAVGMLAGCGNSDSGSSNAASGNDSKSTSEAGSTSASASNAAEEEEITTTLPYGLRQRIRQATAVSGCRPCAISLQRSIHPGTLPLITVYAQRAMQKIP